MQIVLHPRKTSVSFQCEVRNPLNGIVLTLEYIAESLWDGLSTAMRKEIETIKTCAGHQTLLLRSIMDLDKIMTGNKNLPMEDFNPVQLCRDVVAMTVHGVREGVVVLMGGANDDMESDDMESSFRVRADAADSSFVGAPTQLNLVLINLLSNAAKFTTEGKVVLSAAVVENNAENEKSDGNQSVIKFTVTDTGPGVPKDQQEKIYGMRDQTGNDAGRAKGFGVGLFVAKQLVQQMGGELQLRSPVTDHAFNKGCEFSFEIRADKSMLAEAGTSRMQQSLSLDHSNITLPSEADTSRMQQSLSLDHSNISLPSEQTKQTLALQKVETSAETAAPVAEAEALEAAKGWRVLLVDDSDINLRLLERKFTTGPFKELKWRVETATTGEKALKKIDEASSGGFAEVGGGEERRRYDLIVFDQNMQPEGILLGTEASRILRDQDSEVLIVGLTGNFMPEDRRRSKESGQDLFWSKPAPASKVALKELMGAMVKRKGGGGMNELIGALVKRKEGGGGGKGEKTKPSPTQTCRWLSGTVGSSVLPSGEP